MAIFNSTAISTGAPVPGFGAGGGQVRTQYTTVALPIGATTTDTINLFKLPANVRVLRLIMKNSALGAGTLNIGDGGFTGADGVAVAADPDRYLAASAVTSASVVVAMASTGVFLKTGRAPLTITAGFAAGTTTTAGTVEVAIEYTVEEPQA
jgi:hypothetical protein